MNGNEAILKAALDGWEGQITGINDIINSIPGEKLMQEVSPGRNRGLYILGHLACINDQTLTLLKFRESMFPELHHAFVDMPDRSLAELPSPAEIKQRWNIVNEVLTGHMKMLPYEEWLQPYQGITHEEFIDQPFKNRFNILMQRTRHMIYHRGQLVFLRER